MIPEKGKTYHIHYTDPEESESIHYVGSGVYTGDIEKNHVGPSLYIFELPIDELGSFGETDIKYEIELSEKIESRKEIDKLKQDSKTDIMFVYAIHRENSWTTDYNVLVFSSEHLAEEIVREANRKYEEWYTIKKHMGFLYEKPQPPKYRIEKLKVVQ